MRILDYLQSENVDMVYNGLRLLGVDNELINELKCCYHINRPPFYNTKIWDYFNNEVFNFNFDYLYCSVLFRIINQVSIFEIIENNYPQKMKIQFTKLKEINYENNG